MVGNKEVSTKMTFKRILEKYVVKTLSEAIRLGFPMPSWLFPFWVVSSYVFKK